MASYRLGSGYTVETAEAGPKTEFATSNPEGDVISTVYLGDADAAELEFNLRVADRLASL